MEWTNHKKKSDRVNRFLASQVDESESLNFFIAFSSDVFVVRFHFFFLGIDLVAMVGLLSAEISLVDAANSIEFFTVCASSRVTLELPWNRNAT